MKFKLGVLFISVVFFVNSNLYPYQAEQNNIQLVVQKISKLLSKQQRTFFFTNNIKPIEISVTNNSDHVISFDVKDLSLKPLSTVDLESIIKRQKRKQILPCFGLGISSLFILITIDANFFYLRTGTESFKKDFKTCLPTIFVEQFDVFSTLDIERLVNTSFAFYYLIGSGIGAISLSKLFKNYRLIKILEKIKNKASIKKFTLQPGKTIKNIVLVKKNNVRDFTLTVHSQDTNEVTTFEVNLAPTR